jgi:putative flippase GtrA
MKEAVRFVRFLFVGAINTVFGYSLYVVLLYLGLHYSAASLLATILGVIFNFFTTGRLVFASMDHRKFFRFCLVYAASYVINVACLAVFDALGANMYLAGLPLILPMALLTYYLNKRFVFGTDMKGFGLLNK